MGYYEENKRPESMERITTEAQAGAFIDEQVAAIKEQVGEGKVLLALSGGVDSSVCAALLIKAIGDQLVCVHVNHGLLRKGEPEQVVQVFRDELGANLIYVDAVDRFLDKLAGVDDPQASNEIIRKVRENHEGLIECRDLLRVNAERGGEKMPHCNAMIRECVEYVEKILLEKGKLKNEQAHSDH